MLSAGGMFGAYQAGVWDALAGWLHPDIVVGASAGALNAWAIAGGASPAELIEHWLAPECSALARFRPTQLPWRGVFDARPVHARIRALWQRYRPRVETGVVVTEVPRLRPRLFCGEEIGWRHLAASAAVPLCYPPVRIDGRWYADGGLLGPLPVWAAARMGATRVIAIHVLKQAPSRLVGWLVRGLRALAPGSPVAPASVEVCVIAPSRPIGSLRDAVFWRHQTVEQWIEMGREDAGRQFP